MGTVEASRMTWPDERVDDLANRVDEGFRQVDRRFERMDERFERVDERFRQVDENFQRIDADLRELRGQMIGMQREIHARFDSLQRSMLQFGGGLIISFVALVAAFVLGH